MGKKYISSEGWTVPAAVIIAVAIAFLVPASVLAEPVTTAQDAGIANIATTLLVVSFVLCICILAVSGFTLWQSHRYYIDTVGLSREITGTTTELHHKVVDLILNLKDFLAHESEMVGRTVRRTGEDKPDESSARIEKIVSNISDTESKIKALEDTLDKLNTQLNFSSRQSAGLANQITALSDIEYAVLFKLSQDPRFFEKQSFSSFGASSKVLDSLLSRQLIVFDVDGKAEVPRDVALALRQGSPDN
jgi:hypothetical protein